MIYSPSLNWKERGSLIWRVIVSCWKILWKSQRWCWQRQSWSDGSLSLVQHHTDWQWSMLLGRRRRAESLPTANNECSVRLGQVTGVRIDRLASWVNSATFHLSLYICWQMLAVLDSPGWGPFNKVKKSPDRPCNVCFINKSCLVDGGWCWYN